MTTWMGAGSSAGHRDAFTIAVALGLCAVVTVLLVIVASPADGVGFLYVLPVGLVAVDLGWRWGLGAAALCFASYLLWTALADADLSVFGYRHAGAGAVRPRRDAGLGVARARVAGDESERWFEMANVMLAHRQPRGAPSRG